MPFGRLIMKKLINISFIALMAAVICICSPISIPAGAIPITLSTFAVYLAGAVLGCKGGTIAVIIYMLIGAAGLPVFSGYTAGIQKLVGITGGYLIGYIPCAFISGLIIDKFKSKKLVYPIAMITGTVVLYFVGTAWFMFETSNLFVSAASSCIIPFLPGDALKIAAASLIAYPLRNMVTDKLLKKA